MDPKAHIEEQIDRQQKIQSIGKMSSKIKNIKEPRCIETWVGGKKKQLNQKQILLNKLIRPRATFILWMILMGRMNNKDNIENFGITTNGICDKQIFQTICYFNAAGRTQFGEKFRIGQDIIGTQQF